MGMYISIGEGTGWSASGGVFDCIVEATRKLFKDDEQCCLKSIYTPLDEQGQSFIVLDYVDESCFNLFYSYCKKAMDDFSLSERAELITESRVPGVLFGWSEVLRIMREDPRYQEPL